MDDFEKKVTITDAMEMEEMDIEQANNNSSKTLQLLRTFLDIQQRRAQAYAKLKRYPPPFLYFCHLIIIIDMILGFSEYMISGGELAYQQLCSEITSEFNDCSKQVLEIESLFLNPDFCRVDLAQLLRAVQTQEKQKLHLTATIQLLKKAGRPSERLVSHENCKFREPKKHECVHVQEITEAAGTEEAEADAEYDNALKEAIRGVQDAVTAINEHLEEVRYEIAALEAE
ncbi:DNA repair REX1-B protein [Citrus sinensis]|nr:DNA repair REX1-B protein [Citrus sinensis]